MTTLRKIIDRLQLFATNHGKHIQSFAYGEWPDRHIQKNQKWPLMFVVPQTPTINDGETTFSFDIILADQTRNKSSQTPDEVWKSVRQVQSDLLLIVHDLVAEIEHGDLFVFDGDESSLQLPVQPIPFEEENEAILSGWNTPITIVVPYELNSCDIPWGDYVPPSDGGDCLPVSIIDQDDNEIASVESGGTYQVLVVSTIRDTTFTSIPTDSIIDNPF